MRLRGAVVLAAVTGLLAAAPALAAIPAPLNPRNCRYSPQHKTRNVDGWSCTWRPTPNVAQQVAVRCRRGSLPRAEIGFLDRIPNG
jgi:hypothetical protein